MIRNKKCTCHTSKLQKIDQWIPINGYTLLCNYGWDSLASHSSGHLMEYGILQPFLLHHQHPL